MESSEGAAFSKVSTKLGFPRVRDSEELRGQPDLWIPRSRTRCFNTAAFKTPVFGNLGTSSRNMLKVPGIKNVDFSAAKNFAIRESCQLQFRAESFDISSPRRSFSCR